MMIVMNKPIELELMITVKANQQDIWVRIRMRDDTQRITKNTLMENETKIDKL